MLVFFIYRTFYCRIFIVVSYFLIFIYRILLLLLHLLGGLKAHLFGPNLGPIITHFVGLAQVQFGSQNQPSTAPNRPITCGPNPTIKAPRAVLCPGPIHAASWLPSQSRRYSAAYWWSFSGSSETTRSSISLWFYLPLKMIWMSWWQVLISL